MLKEFSSLDNELHQVNILFENLFPNSLLHFTFIKEGRNWCSYQLILH